MAANTHTTSRTWTPEQIEKFKVLASGGASIIRIGATVKKGPSSIL